jgi:prophage regulatory protein
MEHPEIARRQFLTFADLKARGIPFTRMHLRRLGRAGKFPRPVNLGANTVVWFASEIDAHIERLAAARKVGA